MRELVSRYFAVIVVVGSLASSVVLACEHSGPRSILNIGCHVDGSVCYMTLEGAPVGAASCMSTNIRWGGADQAGRTTLSLMYGAFLAGKKVDLCVDTTGCFAAQPAFPTFHWYYVGL